MGKDYYQIQANTRNLTSTSVFEPIKIKLAKQGSMFIDLMQKIRLNSNKNQKTESDKISKFLNQYFLLDV